MATYQPLDAITRQSVIDQATQRAKASGRTAERELYDYAQSQGIDNAGIDQYMGFQSGATDSWLNQSQGPQLPAAQPAAPAPTSAYNGGAALTPSEITNANQWMVGKTGGQVTDQAKALGVSSDQMAQLFGTNKQEVETNYGYGTNTGYNGRGATATYDGTRFVPAAAGAPTGATPQAKKTYQPLDAGTRTSIIAQANDLAKRNGTSVGIELSKYAQSQGIDNDGVDTLMGYQSGTAAGMGAPAGGAPGSGGATGGPGAPGSGGATGGPGAPGIGGPAVNLGQMGQWGQKDWIVDPKTQTVAGQLESVLASDSPLLQQARTRALQSQNSQGRLNSTMAQSAADAAMYDAALPIAQAGAQTYADSAKTNAASANTFSLAGIQQGYTRDNMNLGQQLDLGKMGAQQGYTQDNMTLGQQFDLAKMTQSEKADLAKLAAQQGYNLATMSASQLNDLAKIKMQGETQTKTATDTADVEGKYKNLAQGSVSATQILSKMQDSLNQLSANTGITDAAVRTKMAADIKANATDALNLIGSMAGDVELGKFVNQIFATP